MSRIKIPPFSIAVLIVAILLSISFYSPYQASAQSTGIACAATPDRVDGQGFNVSSLGFNVSSLGFNVSSLEDILNQILTTEITPAWLTNPRDTVIAGGGYNSVPTYILVIDDFSGDNPHGVKVRTTIDRLIAAIDGLDGESTLNISVMNVDISDIDYDATLIAGRVKGIVDGLPANAHVVLNMSFGLVPCDDPTDVTLVDDDVEEGETPTTFTVTEDFNFMGAITEPDPEDRPFQKILPILECVVRNGRHGITAYFGYYNPNAYTVEMPIGSHNKFAPWPKDRGQPTQFAPGRQEYVFSVSRNRGALVWKLGHKIAIATKHSKKCKGDIPPPPSEILPDGYSLTNYFSEQMGIPDELVDEYFEYLFNAADETNDDDPTMNLQALIRHYLKRAYDDANDEDPNTNFAFMAVASAGNFRYLFPNGAPLKPAIYPEVIATSASVGDFGTFWPFSHDGNIIAPGVSIILEEAEENGVLVVKDLGAGTSFASPYVSSLAALWLTYPNACDFNAEYVAPTTIHPSEKAANATFSAANNPLNCGFNLPPEIDALYATYTLDEGMTVSGGSVSDPEGDPISLSTDNPNFVATYNGEGGWSLSAKDGVVPTATTTVVVTASDDSGGEASVTVEVIVYNLPPTATFNVDETMVEVGDMVTLSLSDFADAGEIDATSLTFALYCDAASEAPTVAGAVTLPVHPTTCTYGEAGTYTAMGVVTDKDGDAFVDTVEITVESTEPENCYAQNVVQYVKGTRRNGSKIVNNRTNSDNALYAPQNNDTINFVSLGFDLKPNDGNETAFIILDFGGNSIFNIEGDDLRIWETSYNDTNKAWKKYPEAVKVYASIDGEYWGDPIGITTDKDQSYDLGDLEYANYIKLVDVSNKNKFGGTADGFDVDAVEGFDCGEVYEEEYEGE